ncbi:MAG: 5-(carboxyamino)imidazole ribonucleotide synthase [Spirochaetota bacterium]
MSAFRPDFARIGIIGGGQLGRMMIIAGTPLGFSFGVLTASADDPAARLADFRVEGELTDRDAILDLAAWADVTTYEIEHIDTDALEDAERRGATILPRPSVLRTVNDKLAQKRVLAAAGVPVPAFFEQASSFPIVQKLRRGGYDGRGVKVLARASDTPLSGESYYEDLIDFQTELAVVVCRSSTGEVASYPVVEMEFDAKANICSRVSVPARLDDDTESRAREIAIAAVEAVDGVGVVAVELFLERDGALLVNELAPRPHNSGHLTIEACETSQFEQHLRAITGLPLGPTTLRSPAVMVNVLGAPRANGRPRLDGLAQLLAHPGVHLHWYGKTEVRPYRKMGHVTIVAKSLGHATVTASQVEIHCRVKGETHED